MRRKIVISLTLTLTLLVALMLTACGHKHEYSTDWTSDATHHWHAAACEHGEEASDKGEHTFGEGVTTVEPTTTAAGEKTFTCSVCGYEKTEVIPPLSTEIHTHSFVGTPVAATCAERGYTGYVCACGVTYQDNYTEKTAHIVAAYTAVGDGTHTGVCTLGHTVTVNCTFASSTTVPECNEQGYTTFTCSVCAYSYRDNYVAATGHSYNGAFEHNDSYHWHSASCSHTTERSEYSPHTYTEAVTAPGCETSGYTTYTCQGCGYSFVGNYTAPTGHTVLEWTHAGSSLLDDLRCAYTETYTGVCSVCGEGAEKTEIVEKHAYYWAITTPATCQTEGVKTYICANESCRYHTPTSASETETYTDSSAHKWIKDEDASNESVTVHKCSVTSCNETKSIVLSESDNVSISDDVLSGTSEITLPEATINFDDGIKNNLSGQGQISVSATTLGEGERESAINSANLTEEQKAALEGKKVYSFTVSTDTADDIHELGGTARISLPYTLSPGETPEDIVVWYLSNGALTAIDATYYEDADGNGFVSFETLHFSSYTVGELTPAERCAKFGHSPKVFAATCTEGGHSVCTICDEILEVTRPLGHNWHSEVTTDATCSENGTMTVECLACDHSYEELIPAVGHYYGLSDYRAAGCTDGGHSTYTCIYCDDAYTVTTPALSHDYLSTVKAPTCTEGGYTEKTCRRCAESVTVDNTAPLGHTFSSVWSTLADGHYHVCTVCGGRGDIDAHIPGTPATETTAEICSVCEYIITPALGHTHTLTKVDAIAPGCLTGGNSEYYTCSCGKWFADAAGAQLITDHTAVFMDAKGHTPVSIPAVDATCTEGGFTAGLKCSVCDKLIRGHVAIPATGHSYTKSVVAPTCANGGHTVYTCHCGDTYIADETPALGHKLVSTVTAPTCTEGGYTTDTCVRCSYTARHSERLPLGHSYSESYTVTASEHFHECVRCGEDTEHKAHIPDYDEATEAHGIKCTVCDYEIAPAVNHTHAPAKTTPAKDATCTVAGNLAYYTCSCGDRFLDVECTIKLGNITDVVIKATGHKILTFGEVEPTCTEDGHRAGAKCERCNALLTGGETIPALGHDEAAVPGTAPTCTEAGREAGLKCNRCGITLEEGEVIPALGHNDVTLDEIPATCTEAGREAGVKCDRCGNILSGCEIIPALGHDEVTETGTPATCTAPGTTDAVTCDRCGETLTASTQIPALGHTPVTTPGVLATCTAPGTTDAVTCDRCSEVLTASTQIPALGHDEVEIPGTAPTCTEAGREAGVKCGRCNETLETGAVIPALGHDEVEIPGTAPTCTEAGREAGVKCGRCNETLETGAVIPALGHTPVTTSGVPATCTAPGTTDAVTCDRCGETLTASTEIPALGHNYSDGFCTRCEEPEPEVGETVIYTFEISFDRNGVTEVYSYKFYEGGTAEQICRTYEGGVLIGTSEPSYEPWIIRNGYVFCEIDEYKTAFTVNADGTTLNMLGSATEYLKYHYIGFDNGESVEIKVTYLFFESGAVNIEYVATEGGVVVEVGTETGRYAENESYVVFVHGTSNTVPFMKRAEGLVPYSPTGDPNTCAHTEKLEISHIDATCQAPAATVYFCPECGDISRVQTGSISEHDYLYGYCFDCGCPEDDTEWQKQLQYIGVLDEGTITVRVVYFYTDGSAAMVMYNEEERRAEFDSSLGTWSFDAQHDIVLSNMTFRIESDGFNVYLLSVNVPVPEYENTFMINITNRGDGTYLITVSVINSNFASVSLDIITNNASLTVHEYISGAAVNLQGDSIRFVTFNENYTNYSGEVMLLSFTASSAEVHLSIDEMYTVNYDGSYDFANYTVQYNNK